MGRVNFAAALKEETPLEPIDEVKTKEREHPGTGQPMEGIEVEPGETATLPVAVHPLDLEAAKRKLAKYEPEIKKMEKKAAELKVVDAETRTTAADMANQAQKIHNQVAKAQKALTKDAHEFKKGVDTLAKGFKDRFQAMKKALTQKLTDYEREQLRRRREAEEKARRAQAEAEAKARAEAEEKARQADKAKAGEAPPEPVQEAQAPVVPEALPQAIMQAPKAVKTEAGSLNTKLVWVFEVEDPQKVPRDYLMVDEQTIQNAVDAGIRQIPGVKIFEDVKVNTRATNRKK